MITTTLQNGSKQHQIDGWIGIQKPNQPMMKTKWRRVDSEYYEINGYSIMRINGKLQCECKGYIFRKNCKHIKSIEGGDIKGKVENIKKVDTRKLLGRLNGE